MLFLFIYLFIGLLSRLLRAKAILGFLWIASFINTRSLYIYLCICIDIQFLDMIPNLCSLSWATTGTNCFYLRRKDSIFTHNKRENNECVIRNVSWVVQFIAESAPYSLRLKWKVKLKIHFPQSTAISWFSSHKFQQLNCKNNNMLLTLITINLINSSEFIKTRFIVFIRN